MISAHTYTLTLPTRATPIPLRSGSITVDGNGAPYINADLNIPLPATAVLGLLDPRQAKRGILAVEQSTAFGKVTRSFNLGLRRRRINHRAATCTLTLASDEALLQDYAPLEDDTTPYLHQASVRALVNYVLGKAIPGVSLAAQTTQDPPVWAAINSTNLVANPRARLDLTGWTAVPGLALSRVGSGGPSYAPSFISAQASSASQLLYQFNGVRIQAGVTYTISLDQNAYNGTSIGFDGAIRDSDGTAVIAWLPMTTAVAGSGWTRRSITFTAPPNAATLDVRSFTTGTVPAGNPLNTTALRVSETTDDFTDTAPLDGSMAATDIYAYSYSGDTSVRTARLERAADLHTWRAGVSAFDFLAPILRMLGLRLVCDETRAWTLRTMDYVATGSLSIRHGVNLIDADDDMDRSGDLICDAAVVRYRWRDNTGAQREAIDKYSLTATPGKVRTIERDTPYPGPGYAQNVVRMAQMRGRSVTARAVSNWSTRPDQDTEFTLTGAPIQVGRVDQVTFELDTDEMTVTSRTTETLPGAITFLTGVIDNLPGVIDAL